MHHRATPDPWYRPSTKVGQNCKVYRRVSHIMFDVAFISLRWSALICVHSFMRMWWIFGDTSWWQINTTAYVAIPPVRKVHYQDIQYTSFDKGRKAPVVCVCMSVIFGSRIDHLPAGCKTCAIANRFFSKKVYFFLHNGRDNTMISIVVMRENSFYM